MKKFYVHHNYSNDLVWYFFHGTYLKESDIPSYFFKEQNTKQVLETKYKNDSIK